MHSFTSFYPKGYTNKAIIGRCDLNLQLNHIGMNTQDIIYPIGQFVSWTIDNLLEPIMDPFNAGVIILGLVALVVWLKVLNGYVVKAKAEGKVP
ncbi:MAG: hypothetical protein CL831_06185 [Crocinitomicaceae bacterium]|nr:hypothetical protein [Crocinitomicaceae bacterium]